MNASLESLAAPPDAFEPARVRRERRAVWRADVQSRALLAWLDVLCRRRSESVEDALGKAAKAGWRDDEPTRRLVARLTIVRLRARTFAPGFRWLAGPRYFFAGQAYYNHWYLSRELARAGARTWLYDWDLNPEHDLYYHGRDEKADIEGAEWKPRLASRFLDWIFRFDVFSFANAHALSFGYQLDQALADLGWPPGEALGLIRALGKTTLYLNNGCLDGVTPSSFARWPGPEVVCSICPWRDAPLVCSDERNRSWGEFRNTNADLQMLLGGNRADYNVAPNIREVPHAYCLDPDVWNPGLEIPAEHRLARNEGELKLFHAVGNFDTRTDANGVNIKSTHHYQRVVAELQAEGWPVEFLFIRGRVPNKTLRFYQLQSDIFLDMLSFGWFGATAREGMMLGKPVICYIRPQWLEQLRAELPDYAAELPVVSATPATVRDKLRELIADPRLRADIGRRSRRFAERWHSSHAAVAVFQRIYRQMQANNRSGRPRAPIEIYPGGAAYDGQ